MSGLNGAVILNSSLNGGISDNFQLTGSIMQTVLKGVGIKDITQLSSSSESGGKNIWVIQLTDGTQKELVVYNGLQGEQGERGEKGDPISVTDIILSDKDDGVNIITLSDGTVITIKNGSKGLPGVQGEQGIQGEQGPQGVSGVWVGTEAPEDEGYDVWVDTDEEYDLDLNPYATKEWVSNQNFIGKNDLENALKIRKFVKAVNGVLPDEDGNITISLPESNTSIIYVEYLPSDPVEDNIYVLCEAIGDTLDEFVLDQSTIGLYKYSLYVYHDGWISLSDTYTKDEIDSMVASAGKVKTVNGVEPDENGNIEIFDLEPLIVTFTVGEKDNTNKYEVTSVDKTIEELQEAYLSNREIIATRENSGSVMRLLEVLNNNIFRFGASNVLSNRVQKDGTSVLMINTKGEFCYSSNPYYIPGIAGTVPFQQNILTKTNTTAYIPTSDYHPATKKYVDDAIAAIQQQPSEQVTDEDLNNIFGEV